MKIGNNIIKDSMDKFNLKTAKIYYDMEILKKKIPRQLRHWLPKKIPDTYY